MCLCAEKKISPIRNLFGKTIIMITIYLNKVVCMSAGEECTGLKLNVLRERGVLKAAVESRWHSSRAVSKWEFRLLNPTVQILALPLTSCMTLASFLS